MDLKVEKKEIKSGIFLTDDVSSANLKPTIVNGKQYLVKRSSKPKVEDRMNLKGFDNDEA